MKKIFLLLCIPAFLLAGCTRLEIPNTNPTAGTETTTDDSDDEDDDSGATDTPELTDPGLAWSASSLIILVDQEDYELPTLTNPHQLPITFASSNSAVATITEDGTVTILNAVGTATMTKPITAPAPFRIPWKAQCCRPLVE